MSKNEKDNNNRIVILEGLSNPKKTSCKIYTTFHINFKWEIVFVKEFFKDFIQYIKFKKKKNQMLSLSQVLNFLSCFERF